MSIHRLPPKLTHEAIERLTGILWRMTDEFESDESRYYWRRAIKDFERVIYGREPKDPIRPPKPRGSADKVRELLSRKAPWEKTTPAQRIIEERAKIGAKNYTQPHPIVGRVNQWQGWNDIKTTPLPPPPPKIEATNKYLLVSDGSTVRLLWGDAELGKWVVVTEGEFADLESYGTWTHWRKVEMPA